MTKKNQCFKGYSSVVFSTFPILNKHQHDLTPEHFHHLEKKASPPHSLPSFCGSHQFALCGCGSACSGIIRDTACGFFLLVCVHACCGIAFRGRITFHCMDKARCAHPARALVAVWVLSTLDGVSRAAVAVCAPVSV